MDSKMQKVFSTSKSKDNAFYTLNFRSDMNKFAVMRKLFYRQIKILKSDK